MPGCFGAFIPGQRRSILSLLFLAGIRTVNFTGRIVWSQENILCQLNLLLHVAQKLATDQPHGLEDDLELSLSIRLGADLRYQRPRRASVFGGAVIYIIGPIAAARYRNANESHFDGFRAPIGYSAGG